MPDVPAMPPLFQRQMATPTTVGHGVLWARIGLVIILQGTANNEGLIGPSP